MLELSKIRTDGGTQSRAAINEETVADYTEALADPATVFPPIVVYFDGREYWLADGFHRVAAWDRVGRTEVPAEIRQGDRRQAVLHSCAANAAHGLRRTNADKRRAVMTLLEDDEWSQWSDREIARRCRVHHATVAKCREEMTGVYLDKYPDSQPRTVERKGTVYQQETAKIGKSPVHEPSETSGADKAGTSVADAADGPAQDEPKPKNPLAGLSREGLEDEVLGLRAENDELRAKTAAQATEIERLKADLADATSSNQGAVISKLKTQLGTAKYQRDEANTAARKSEYKARKAFEERDAALKSLHAQEFEL